jgi:DNA-binding Lrp family transcriptional regulator
MKIVIDEIDRKIILSLRQNGRTSNVDLSGEMGLGVATVAKRVENLISDKIIQIKAVVNPFRMGHNAHAFILLDLDLTKVDSICERLIKNPNVSLVVTSFGRCDVIIIVDFPSWEILHDFMRHDLTMMEGVKKAETHLVADIKKRYNGIFDSSSANNNPVSIDEIDKKLIAELQADGRVNYAYLAEKLNIGVATVSRRIAALLKDNTIKIIAVPNPSKLGQIANANIALSVEPQKITQICEELVRQEPVYMVMTMMNGFDILVGVAFSNPEGLYNFITQKIARINGVTNIETFMRAEIKKADYARLDLPL